MLFDAGFTTLAMINTRDGAGFTGYKGWVIGGLYSERLCNLIDLVSGNSHAYCGVWNN